MRVSSRADYGVRALFELARTYGRGPLQSRQIAQRQSVPEAYLHQVLSALNRGGLVRSTRGPSGGHELARPPEEISILAAMEVLDGLDPKAHPHRINPGGDVVHLLWHDLYEQSVAFLGAITLEDLLEQERERQQAGTYSI